MRIPLRMILRSYRRVKARIKKPTQPESLSLWQQWAIRWKRLRLSEARIRNSRPYSRIFRMRKSLNHSFSLWDLTKHLLRVSGIALCTLFVVILDLFVILMSISFVLCCLTGVFRWMRCVLQ